MADSEACVEAVRSTKRKISGMMSFLSMRIYLLLLLCSHQLRDLLLLVYYHVSCFVANLDNDGMSYATIRCPKLIKKGISSQARLKCSRINMCIAKCHKIQDCTDLSSRMLSCCCKSMIVMTYYAKIAG